MIVNFWSAECPHAERFDTNITTWLAQWGDDVSLIAIASNANETDAQINGAFRHTLARRDDAERHARGRRLAGAVRADQRDDLAALHVKIDIAHEPAAGAHHAGLFQAHERLR